MWLGADQERDDTVAPLPDQHGPEITCAETIGIVVKNDDNPVVLTVGIPTWNRARLLRKTLQSVAALRIPHGVHLEVIVADNNSTDGTARVLEETSSHMPLVSLHEPRQGKSWALNAIVKRASGKYIIWIDDDVRLQADWLSEYWRGFNEHPGAVLFGGTIEPHFEGSPPGWLPAALKEVPGVYGVCTPPDEAITLDGGFLPFGANMAIRTDLQREFRFDVRYGRKAGGMLAGEEGHVAWKILEAGHEGRWIPAAKVFHMITREMQTLRHIRRYYVGFGRTMTLEGADSAKTSTGRRSLWVWRQALQGELCHHISRWTGRPPEVWLGFLRDASVGWGLLRGVGRHPGP